MTFAIAKWVSSIGGAMLVMWSLIARADDALLSHLADIFASKDDLIRIEHKLDQLIARQSFALPKSVPSSDSEDLSSAGSTCSSGSRHCKN